MQVLEVAVVLASCTDVMVWQSVDHVMCSAFAGCVDVTLKSILQLRLPYAGGLNPFRSTRARQTTLPSQL